MANEIDWWLLLRIAAGQQQQNTHSFSPTSLDMLSAWLEADIGDRLDRINHLAEHPADDVRLILEGYAETIRHRGWAADLNAEPYDPWQINTLGFPLAGTDDLGRLAGDEAAAIRAAISSSALSATFDPNAFRWTTTSDDFTPALRVRLGGELIHVGGIATTATTFVAAGTAAHDNNANVTPGLPAGVAADDLLLIFAAIRNSGTGVPQAPTGYTRLPIFGSSDNAQVFGKVHSGSESDPTVTFTGGVANADTSAQMCAFRGMPITLDDLGDVVLESGKLLNASAQDITTPGLSAGIYDGRIALLFGWKQDDWTSVAPPTGFTEIGEPDTTTGDDQGLTWAYRIDTTATAVSSTSFVVTGGASAISRSASASLAGGYQTMTITDRSVNGVEKAHAAGTRIECEDALVLGI